MELYSFDDEYLKRLQQGDPFVEQHFFSYFSKMLLIKLRSRLRSPESVDDVRQETFLRVLRTIRSEDGIRSAQKLGSYVNSVCNFVLFEHYRSGKREDPMGDGVAEPPGPHDRPTWLAGDAGNAAASAANPGPARKARP